MHAAVDAVHDALDLLTTADLDVLATEDLRLLTGRLLQVGHRVDAATLRLVHQPGPARGRARAGPDLDRRLAAGRPPAAPGHRHQAGPHRQGPARRPGRPTGRRIPTTG